MALFRFELVKLAKRRVFLALTAAALLGCFLTAILVGGGASSGGYVAGTDVLPSESGTSEEDLAYIESYRVFVEEMAQRVAAMGSTTLFSDRNSFAYRNLVKTQEDYASFRGTVLSPGDSAGIEKYADWSGSVLFALAFFAVLTYYVLFYERGQNLLLLLKGCRRGHGPLGWAKLGAMALAAALYTLLQELGLLAIFQYRYGLGNLVRPIQSIPLFRNCALHLSVGGGLALMVAVRAAIAVVIAAFFYLVGTAVRNEALAVLVGGGVLGFEAVLASALSSSSVLNWLKFINPIYLWGVRNTLGEYCNLDLFGWPVGKGLMAVVAGAISTGVMCCAGTAVFARSHQTRTSGVWERALLWLREKTAPLWRTVSLVWFEFHKLLLGQGRAVVLALLVLWGAYEAVGVTGERRFALPEDAAYYHYAVTLQGKVTQDKLDALDKEAQRFDDLHERLRELASSGLSEEEIAYESSLIQGELYLYEAGYHIMKNQVDQLQTLPGDIADKYIVNERELDRLWNDAGNEVRLWLIGAVFAIVLLSGVRTGDEKRGMTALLRSTLKGRDKLDSARHWTALLLTLAAFAASQLPLLLQYVHAGAFSTLGQRLCWFTGSAYVSGCTIGLLLAIVFVLKALSFLAVCFGGETLTRLTGNAAVAMLAGAGIIGAVGGIMLGFGADICTIVLNLLN